VATSVYTRTLYQAKDLGGRHYASPGEGRLWVVRNIDVWCGEPQIVPWGLVQGPEGQGIWAWGPSQDEPPTLIGGFHDHYEGRFVVEGLQALYIQPESGRVDITITGYTFTEPAGATVPLAA
jgi:hypothetical protein